MNPLLTVYHHPLGYDSFRFSFWLKLDRVSMFLPHYRRCQLPPWRATRAKGCHNHNKWHYCDDCAMFLNLSLLEDVGRLWLCLMVRCLNKFCLGAKTIMSHLYWSSSCSQLCVNPILGLQCVLILIMQLGGCVGTAVSLLTVMADRGKLLLSVKWVLLYYFWTYSYQVPYV